MKLIKLTQGQFAQVDDEDFEFLNQWKWYAKKHGHTFYAIRADYSSGKMKNVRMHRVILGLAPDDRRISDHIDHCGYNNQRVNLRICTYAQNCMNSQKQKRATSSKYKGVTINISKWFSKEKQQMVYYEPKFIAAIRVNGKLLSLGSFSSEIEAARKYNEGVLKYFGEFGVLNDV